ncbi:MAG: hypothetical protein LQ342_006428 [Letrouitia transgressa]|nr:MAG: hypothetical protein LQ342_006428 [Letrouitia transgressa]
MEVLKDMAARLGSRCPVMPRLEEILGFVQSIQNYSTTMQAGQLFEKLQPLRAWLFWMPINMLVSDKVRGSEMVLLAQLYAVALAVDSSIPELRGAALGSLTWLAIHQIDQKLRFDRQNTSLISPDLDALTIEKLMQFSRSMTLEHQTVHTTGHSTQAAFVQGQQNPYGLQQLNLGSSSSTPVPLPRTPATDLSSFTSQFSTGQPQSLNNLGTPASPFLRCTSAGSSRHSQLMESSPSLGNTSFDAQSLSSPSFRDDPSEYSPGYQDRRPVYPFEGPTPTSFPGEFVAPTLWA